MSMFMVTGEVRTTYFQPGQFNKETKEAGAGSMKVQILGVIPVAGGSSKEDIITLSVPDGLDFQPLLKRTVSVPLGFFSPAKGAIVYFIPRGSEVVIID